MNKSIEISGRKIGYDYKPLVIAEIGINHGGSLGVAKQMVDTAVNSGIEIIKHQTHIVDDEMSQEANRDKVDYLGKTIFELMDECALNEQEEIELKNYVESKGAIFISTPFSRAAADRLYEFDIPAFKIGSGECNNYPLIEHICKFKKPVILSTGMNTINSVKKSVSLFEKYSIPYALLHTTNIYPTPPHLVRLGAMTDLQKTFPKAVIGLSDHTTSNHACFGAVALGASILERHFTDKMSRKGPDIINSMDPISAKELIEGANIIKLERGGKKEPVLEEQPEIAFADLDENANLAELFLKGIVKRLLERAFADMSFFQERIDSECLERLDKLTMSSFERMNYEEAISILEKSGEKFEFPVSWGMDLQSEHERWLTEKHVKGPLVVTNYPKEIKAFYMRANDDGKTVSAMDVLVPGIGEIIGGAQREERADVLELRMKDVGLNPEEYSWYIDLRRYGTVPHSGFGLGFERLIQYVTGMNNIRDVIPFPRTPRNCQY